MHRRRPRRRKLLDARVGPGPDGAGGVQLRRGDAAVPSGGRGAGAADRGHALFRLLGMNFIELLHCRFTRSFKSSLPRFW